MAKDQRLAHADRAEAAMQIVMQVRAADAAGLDLDADLPRTGFADRDLVDAEVLFGMDDDGAHGGFSLRGRRRPPSFCVGSIV